MHRTNNSHISDAQIDWPALKDVLADAGYTSRPVSVLFADHFQANANDLIARRTGAASRRGPVVGACGSLKHISLGTDASTGNRRVSSEADLCVGPPGIEPGTNGLKVRCSAS